MQIKYLSHTTNLDTLHKIIKDKYLYTTLERDKIDRVHNIIENNFPYLYEFPGLFMSWHTGHNDVPGNIVIILSSDLLKMQKNYHINLVDHNGFFTETFTYFPENIEKMPDYKKVCEFCNFCMNEIVFHDKIHIDLIAFIWFRTRDLLVKAKKIFPPHISKKCKMFPKNLNITVNTPKKSLNKVDFKSEAVRVFSSDDKYTGMKIPLYLPHLTKKKFRSSLKYVRNIARTAGVSEEILKELKTKKDIEYYLNDNSYYYKAFESRLKK